MRPTATTMSNMANDFVSSPLGQGVRASADRLENSPMAGVLSAMADRWMEGPNLEAMERQSAENKKAQEVASRNLTLMLGIGMIATAVAVATKDGSYGIATLLTAAGSNLLYAVYEKAVQQGS